MGRYFILRAHPFSIKELIDPTDCKKFPTYKKYKKTPDIKRLIKWGGFPEPYIKADKRFYNRWKKLKHTLLFKEDIRELSQVQELAQMEILAEILKNQIGSLTQYKSLSTKVRVSIDTIKRWLEILKSFYYCFDIKPWKKNVTRSLLKKPKFYLYDWSLIDDEGTRFENFIASHLLKAVHHYEDLGYGKLGLYFLRDKEKREVDFIVTKENNPWFIVETKLYNEGPLSKNLFYYQKMLKIPHAFQVVRDLPYERCNCFLEKIPMKVSASTFLSQLI